MSGLFTERGRRLTLGKGKRKEWEPCPQEKTWPFIINDKTRSCAAPIKGRAERLVWNQTSPGTRFIRSVVRKEAAGGVGKTE